MLHDRVFGNACVRLRRTEAGDFVADTRSGRSKEMEQTNFASQEAAQTAEATQLILVIVDGDDNEIDIEDITNVAANELDQDQDVRQENEVDIEKDVEIDVENTRGRERGGRK
ncbi:hypothetical protein [Mesobacillus harenae]|uniref:hypothetical protein n=1 Tax=Mesobacillus harenae TaxID=2213203 RepID=UPI001580A4FF|nr:hypothetical protein [Mesobacillus harenae]